MRSLAGAPFGLVREMRRTLGSIPLSTLGQATSQDLEDEFVERWAAGRSLGERARIEQEYLGKFANRATSWESSLRTELAREPRLAGRIVELVDGAERAAKFLDNVATILPTTGQIFPASASVGLNWTGPADALVARFRNVRDGGCTELERMREEFARYPATPTPRVCPTKPPEPRQSDLPSGEEPGRPRTIFDDILDFVKEKALLLALLAAWGYVVYEVSSQEPEKPVRRRRVLVRA